MKICLIKDKSLLVKKVKERPLQFINQNIPLERLSDAKNYLDDADIGSCTYGKEIEDFSIIPFNLGSRELGEFEFFNKPFSESRNELNEVMSKALPLYQKVMDDFVSVCYKMNPNSYKDGRRLLSEAHLIPSREEERDVPLVMLLPFAYLAKDRKTKEEPLNINISFTGYLFIEKLLKKD